MERHRWFELRWLLNKISVVGGALLLLARPGNILWLLDQAGRLDTAQKLVGKVPMTDFLLRLILKAVESQWFAVLCVAIILWGAYISRQSAIERRCREITPPLAQFISDGDLLEQNIRGDHNAEQNMGVYEYRDEQWRSAFGTFLNRELPGINAARLGTSNDGDTVGRGIVFLYSRLKRSIDGLLEINRHLERYVERSNRF